ncbi:MAG: hypothetical protein ACKOXH_09050, partial [Aquirufa sp.]
ILWIFLCYIPLSSWGQYAVLDQNPFSLKFYKISMKSAPLDLYFPAGYDSIAFSTAQQILSNWSRSKSHFPSSKRRFPILLQNQALISNGFVSLIPPRAEFYTTPSQDAALLGNNDWLTLLQSHELRHVHQNNAASRGISRWVHGLFGAFGQSVYSNLMIPNW